MRVPTHVEVPETTLNHLVTACVVLVVKGMSGAQAQLVALILCGLANDSHCSHLVGG